MWCIDLNVGCPQADELRNFLAQNADNVSQKRIKRWIGSFGIFRRPKVAPQAGARKCYLGNAVRFALEIRKLACREITKSLQFRDRPKSPWPAGLLRSLFVVPLTPKKGIEIVFTKATDGGGHLALKRLPPHFPIGHDFQADAFLQLNGIVDGLIFDPFELSPIDKPSGQPFLPLQELRRPKQAPDDVAMMGDHVTWLLQNLLCLKQCHRVYANLFLFFAFIIYPLLDFPNLGIESKGARHLLE